MKKPLDTDGRDAANLFTFSVCLAFVAMFKTCAPVIPAERRRFSVSAAVPSVSGVEAEAEMPDDPGVFGESGDGARGERVRETVNVKIEDQTVPPRGRITDVQRV